MQEEINLYNNGYIRNVNTKVKLMLFEEMEYERKSTIQFLRGHKEEILKLNKYEKWALLYPYVAMLSNHTDKEVLDILKALGLTKYVIKYFISYLDFFESLDRLQDDSKYILLYTSVCFCYANYGRTFIKKQLAYDLGIDWKRDLDKLSRQERDGRLPEIFSSIHVNLKEQQEFLKKEMPEYKFPVYDDRLTKTIKKISNFSHKIDFYNLYMDLLDFNKKVHSEKLIDIGEFNEPDFKCEFYNLLELLLRDTSLLKNDKDTQLSYGELNSKRFKVKRVERLILS